MTDPKQDKSDANSNGNGNGIPAAWLNNFERIIKFVFACMVSFIAVSQFQSSERERVIYETQLSIAEGSKRRDLEQAIDDAGHAKRKIDCWADEGRFYSEATELCTGPAQLPVDTEQSRQIDGNSGVLGAVAEASRIHCEALLKVGIVDTCKDQP